MWRMEQEPDHYIVRHCCPTAMALIQARYSLVKRGKACHLLLLSRSSVTPNGLSARHSWLALVSMLHSLRSLRMDTVNGS